MTVSEAVILPQKYCKAHKGKQSRFPEASMFLFLAGLFALFLFLFTGCTQPGPGDDGNLRKAGNFEKLGDEEDFLAFSLEADKKLLAVHFANNPSKLNTYDIKPVRIRTKKDLQKYLEPFWGYTFIEKKWQEGSKKVPDKPFGFEKKDTGFLSASDVKYEKVSKTKVLITGKVCQPLEENKFRIREMSIEKTKSGWKATDIQYKELGEK